MFGTNTRPVGQPYQAAVTTLPLPLPSHVIVSLNQGSNVIDFTLATISTYRPLTKK